MQSNDQFPLERDVHVDEFEIGLPQKGEQGRSKSKKKARVVIAVEYREGKSVSAYSKGIYEYSTASLKPIFDSHMKADANILADGWSGHKPLTEDFQKYIDEYFFRFNRRNHRTSILDKIIERFVLKKPIAFKLIQLNEI